VSAEFAGAIIPRRKRRNPKNQAKTQQANLDKVSTAKVLSIKQNSAMAASGFSGPSVNFNSVHLDEISGLRAKIRPSGPKGPFSLHYSHHSKIK